jgi:hypothetical protein
MGWCSRSVQTAPAYHLAGYGDLLRPALDCLPARAALIDFRSGPTRSRRAELEMVTGDQTRAGAHAMGLMEGFYKRQVTLKV